jgi:NAD+ synthase (glutamine-hydrolysing)
MARTFRLALAQLNLTVGDLPGNTARMVEYLHLARESGADLVAFPELATTGYPPEDLLFKKSFIDANIAAMEQVVAESRGIAVVLGYVRPGPHPIRPHLNPLPGGEGIEGRGGIANAAAIGYDGRLIDAYDKIFLPNYGVFDEERYFVKGRVCPVYEIGGVRVGVNVCEDIWYEVGPSAVQRQAGAELIVNINASPFHAGKSAYRRDSIVGSRAAGHGLFVAYLNIVGGQDELVFDGNSMICDPCGKVVARGPAFREAIILADIDVDAVPLLPSSPSGGACEESLAAVGVPKSVYVSGHRPDAERSPLSCASNSGELEEIEEIYHALALGTRDYLHKTGFRKAIVGLSGGIDSALTAVIAADALGPENVLGITMPSRHSSRGSIEDSAELARNLGIEFWEIPIEPAHTAFADMLEQRFAGTTPNVAEENVQARIRGNVLMTVSNKFGWIVLTTGNKSEMAMGYATLYGDMAGGFAVLKDVHKMAVYALSRWRNANGHKFPLPPGGGQGEGVPGNAVIPQAIIDKPPSAELREGQLDEDSLPPYDILDPVIQAYVEDDCSYAEMVAQGHDPAVVRQVIAAVDRNEYKRRQAPPGVKITPRAFGRDRRLPIVNRYRQG